MRKLVRTLAASLLILTLAPGAVGHASAAAAQPKVVLVVGAVQGTTSSYRSDADTAAAYFAKYTSNIVKVYSPNATWSAVQAAAQDASVLVYLGHGSGWPNPYVSYLQPNGDNGMGLNAAAGAGDGNTKYYGENYMAMLNLAPNAVVILWHLCYASGDNEWGSGLPSAGTAQTRIDGYASGFLRGNARAVIVDGLAYRLDTYIDGLFGSHTTVDAVWKSAETFNNHVTSWSSGRNSGFVSQMDPSLDHPAADGDVYYRSMVSMPGLKTDDIGADGFVPPAPSTYYPISPTRLLDTRNGVGLSGPFVSMQARTFVVTGGKVPDDATAVTGNLTVTDQNSIGWLYVGPDPLNTPGTSTLNFPVGDDRANNVTVALGSATVNGTAHGALSVTYVAPRYGPTADVIFDVTGYFKADQKGSTFHPLAPARILDTRDGTGLSGAFTSTVPRAFQVRGAGNVPAQAVAVTGNLTVTGQTSRGWLYIGPDSAAAPGSSTLNFPVGDDRANGVTAMLTPDGRLWVTFVAPSAGPTTHAIFDVTGYYTADLTGASYVPLPPARILDTRIGINFLGAVSAQHARTVQVVGFGHVAATATAVTGNLTVTGQSQRGFLYLGPTANDHPASSTLNFPVGDNRANGVTVALGGGALGLTYGAPADGPTSQAIFDVTGYFK